MKKITSIFSILLILQGCSSIEQPIAQRALVEHEYVDPASSVDSALANALNNALPNTAMMINGEQFSFGSKFFSASGLTCRDAMTSTENDKIFCQRAPQNWFEVNRVISEYRESQELNAK